MATINMGKARRFDTPYLIITDPTMPGWTWRVLKAYKADPATPYARWLCAVSSPYTQGGYDIGDVYVSDVGTVLEYRDPDVQDGALPAFLR